jgi:hypothetical protein
MKCRLCRSNIEEGAKVCPTCKHYQSILWNALLYLSGLVAVASILGASSVYVIKQLDGSLKRHFGTIGIEVIEFRSDLQATLENTGQRDLYVSGVILESPTGKNFFTINRVIAAGTLEVIGDTDSSGEPAFRCIKGDIAQQILEGKLSVKNQGSQYYNAGHPQLRAHHDLDEHPATDAKGTLVYRAVGDTKSHGKKFDCVFLIVQYADENGEYSDELVPGNKDALTDENSTLKPLPRAKQLQKRVR